MEKTNSSIFLYNKLEIAIEQIFKTGGYSYKRGVPLSPNSHLDIDGVASDSQNTYVIEIKSRAYLESIRRGGEYIRNVAANYPAKKGTQVKAMLIVADVVSSKCKEYFDTTFSNDVELIDITHLLYSVKDNEPVRKLLIDSLDYSVENIPTQKWRVHLLPASCDPADDLIKRLKGCSTGPEFANDFELICIDIIKYLFGEELWKLIRHQHSNKDLYEFDAVARIKDKNEKTFWTLIDNKFNTKYIVFEFKNYEKPITQTQIYTTEKYLYSTALRCVGIIFTRKGAHKNALWAANGCLRESGKIILIFDEKEIVNMIKKKKADGDPSEDLMIKLDNLLLTLEK